MQSGLVLAQGQTLTLSKIIGKLELSATRLVTLSACETGITDIRQSPDEYLGLPAGFLQVGAPAVISSLWPVNDMSTMLLMKRFYQNLLGHDGTAPLPPASALCAAQRWLRKASAKELREHSDDVAAALRKREASDTPFSHPHHWAAFTFSGA